MILSVLRPFPAVCLALVLNVAAPAGLLAQSADWQAHTPMRQITSIDITHAGIWAATLGGVFSYTFDSGEINRFTTVQGLHGIDARAIGVSEDEQRVWIGYGDGVIDLLDTESFEVRSFLDIARADQFQQRGINRLKLHGDSLFVLTDFGLVVFDTREMVVRDAYTRVGNWQAATPIRDVLVLERDGQDEIWLASQRGVASAPLSGDNLQEPTSWTMYGGPALTSVNALAVFEGLIYAATEWDVLRRWRHGAWEAVGLTGNPVFDMVASDDRLVVVEEFSLVTLEARGQKRRQFLFTEGPLGDPIQYLFPRHIGLDSDGRYWVGDEREGLVAVDNLENLEENISETLPVVPAGPQNGLFTNIVFDRDGDLWVSGAPGNSTGFHQLNGSAWTDYTARSVAELAGRASYDHIHADTEGTIWAGSAGRGIAMVTDNNEVTTYDHTNSSLRPAEGTQDYVRVLGMATDREGTLWAINQFSPFPLVTRTSDGQWSSLPAVRASGAPSTLSYQSIHIDSYGQKWLICDHTQGMVVFDSGDDPVSTSDDVATYIRGRGAGGVGLPNETVTAWVQDGFGSVWIGTERGIAVYVSPSLVLFDDPGASEAQWPITETESGERAYLLRDLFVNDMFVDAANNLWIASKDGVWQLRLERAGGAEIVRHFTTENSPLFSNDVAAVGVSARDGRVYFATNKGMLSWQGDAVAAVPEASALFIYPNPVVVDSNADPAITIDGLVAETDIRILDISGNLVRQLDGRGGRVVWDGRVAGGEQAPSGIYIVAAVGKDGEGTAYGKIALVR